jgi:hypothetical protein
VCCRIALSGGAHVQDESAQAAPEAKRRKRHYDDSEREREGGREGGREGARDREKERRERQRDELRARRMEAVITTLVTNRYRQTDWLADEQAV